MYLQLFSVVDLLIHLHHLVFRAVLPFKLLHVFIWCYSMMLFTQCHCMTSRWFSVMTGRISATHLWPPFCIYCISCTLFVHTSMSAFRLPVAVIYLRGSVAYWSVMWSETVGLRTRPVWDQKIGLGLGFGLAICGLGLGLAHCGLGLGLAVLVLFCETRSCNAHRHNDLEGHINFSSTI